MKQTGGEGLRKVRGKEEGKRGRREWSPYTCRKPAAEPKKRTVQPSSLILKTQPWRAMPGRASSLRERMGREERSCRGEREAQVGTRGEAGRGMDPSSRMLKRTEDGQRTVGAASWLPWSMSPPITSSF